MVEKDTILLITTDITTNLIHLFYSALQLTKRFLFMIKLWKFHWMLCNYIILCTVIEDCCKFFKSITFKKRLFSKVDMLHTRLQSVP
mmetsp:Transcript_30150/g.59692  ORF Transcript_30150/g.59692 Transcript_30150/m.59692 type:complete len:87 (-) Transcript_30150:117-377(-)